MPLNSNGTFDNQFKSYNLTRVLNPDNTLNEAAYRAYSPPYYSISFLFTMGANNAYYTFSAVYVFTRYRKVIWKGLSGMVINTMKGRSIYTGFNDGNSRLMRKYPEVPEWWYAIILAVGFVLSIVSVAAFPTGTPWWSILLVLGLGIVMTIPEVILHSIAAADIPLGQIWQVLPGVWFPGKFLPNIILQMLGDAFGSMASGFANALKTGHYARIPPRCIFRTHLLSIFLNALTIVSTVTLLEAVYNSDGTFCQWDNKQFMVCGGVHGFYSSVIAYGALGTNNLFKLYPALPWTFLLGAGMALAWFAGEALAPKLRLRFVSGMDEEQKAEFDRKWWNRTSNAVQSINPAIALRGAAGWSGNNNLTQSTVGLYLSWLFQYYLKRKYTAWWGKYAFMIFAGLGIGYTISGLIGTLVFSFGAGQGTTAFNYRANTIGRTGVDFDLYTNAVALLPLPAKGYFGLEPGQYPI